MGFALYELAQHQDIQEKARQEITQVLEKYNNKFNYEAMKEMQYLEQIVAETLRLYTIIPLLTRFALEDYPVPGHPRGTSGRRVHRSFGRMVKEQQNIVEVKELLARFTTDVIGTCAFGIECSSLKDPNAEFRVMGRKALVEQRHNRLVIAFMASFVELARKLHFKQTPDEIEEFLCALLEKRSSIAFVFFSAGFETSSTTMGFALYELAQNEEVQARARQEILQTLEKHNQQLTYECMKEMVYLEQVMAGENITSLHSLPILNRSCLEDYVVPGHPNFVIKKMAERDSVLWLRLVMDRVIVSVCVLAKCKH
ncbi:Cytochrome P450 6a9 [Eumeta japonica]|uniref:unspecific monooxygenase n=1 Tax=Eumeta variegata TaxID=151549 RepID=A0A4C2ABG9_EUMVA|nr:Cytochrome P450 6a9 [Eumeta japonica]